MTSGSGADSGLGRRTFLKGMGLTAVLFALGDREVNLMEPSTRSKVFKVSNCPVPHGEDLHEGLEALLDLMSWQGVDLYRTEQKGWGAGPEGLIEKDDVVLIKVNGQWKYRGCTNSDVIRGLARRILDHPNGFEGEVVIFDNGQGQGSMEARAKGFGHYDNDDVHANAEDESHSYMYLAEEVFKDSGKVSCYLLDGLKEIFIADDEHVTDGYRKTATGSYPCFTTKKGTRIELREGVWTGNGYSPKLKLVNVPVLKHHGGCGVTAAVKHYYGVLSMGYRPLDYHYGELGLAVGEMMTKVRGPVLNILDAIWISPVNHYGLPQDVQRLNILGASLDPVALDYWGCKHVLYPAATNPEHNPDLFQPLGHYLEQARDTINKNGGLFGRQVNLGDENTELVSYASVIDQVLQAATRNEVNGDIADRMKERADAGM